MTRNVFICGGLAALALFGLIGCRSFDAAPAADAGFNRISLKMTTRAAFLHQSWLAREYRGKPVHDYFTAVYIAPVDVRYMIRQKWWQQQQQGLRNAEFTGDAQHLALLMRQKFQQAIEGYPGKSIQLANAPGPRVLVLELALVELVPSNAYLNAGATAAGMVVPGAGFLSMAGSGSIAIEGRARNGTNQRVIATFKDRRNDKSAPVNLGSYTWYHGAETNITDWAAEFAELLNTPPDHVVERASAITLKPW